ncbi:UNVERIFIED_CONTAM: hypothetical protein FKN15_006640 [Acipenser sinensis]
MENILDYSVSSDYDLFAVSPELRSLQPIQPAPPVPDLSTPRQLRSAVFTTPTFTARMSASPVPSHYPLSLSLVSRSPVRRSSCLATCSSATPDIRDWMIPRLQHYLHSNNIPFKSAARKENLFNIFLSTLQNPSCRQRYDDSTDRRFAARPHPLPQRHKAPRLHPEDAEGGTFTAPVNLRLIQQFLIQRWFYSQECLLLRSILGFQHPPLLSNKPPLYLQLIFLSQVRSKCLHFLPLN